MELGYHVTTDKSPQALFPKYYKSNGFMNTYGKRWDQIAHRFIAYNGNLKRAFREVNPSVRYRDYRVRSNKFLHYRIHTLLQWHLEAVGLENNVIFEKAKQVIQTLQCKLDDPGISVADSVLVSKELREWCDMVGGDWSELSHRIESSGGGGNFFPFTPPKELIQATAVTVEDNGSK